MSRVIKPIFTTDQQVIVCQIPGNLNLDQIIASNPATNFKSNREMMVYLIDLIIKQYTWRKKYNKRTCNDYVPLHSTKMKEICKNYHLYVRYLSENGIIEVDDSYKVGERSKGYRLAKQYHMETIDCLISEPKIVNAIQKQKEQAREAVIAVYPNLVRWFDELEIDAEGAYAFIDQWYKEQLVKSKRTPKPKRLRRLILAKNSYRQSVRNIQHKDYWFSVDDSGHRLHTVLTNMKKDLRKFVTYKGQPLVCVDLSNSQPFLSLQLLKEQFYHFIDKPCSASSEVTLFDLPDKVKERIRSLIDDIRKLITSESFTSPWLENLMNGNYKGYASLTFRASVQLSDKPTIGQGHINSPVILYETVDDFNNLTVIIECDWISYALLIIEGNFYRYTGNEIQKRWPDSIVYKKPKSMVISVLFANDLDKRTHFVNSRNMFRSLFPTPYELFRIIKSTNHATLAVLLQSIESEIFLNRIAKRISEERPEIPIYTIHDSICTTRQHEHYIEQVVKEEIYIATGKYPHLKNEYW